MAEIVWLLRVGIALTCLISLLVLAVGAVVVVYKIRLDNRSVPYRQRPGLLLPATFSRLVTTAPPAEIGDLSKVRLG